MFIGIKRCGEDSVSAPQCIEPKRTWRESRSVVDPTPNTKDGHLPGMIHEMTEWQSTIDRVYSLAAEKRVKRNEGRQNTDA